MRLIVSLALYFAICGSAIAADSASPRPKAMVAAANPAAVEAGLKVLRRGGSAMDAAVAVQATLGLVEPQSSGLGGGAFLTWYDPVSRKVTTYDGRETAPAGASRSLFLKPDGKPMGYAEAVLSGRSAGVPGAVAMLRLAHRDHGKLAWSSLFADTAQLASDGFIVGPRLIHILAGGAPQTKAPDVIAYFKGSGGAPLKVGDKIRNLAYAATLRKIAACSVAKTHTSP